MKLTFARTFGILLFCVMLDDIPVTIMAKNYSHCPLKKRPVPVFDECSGRFQNLSYLFNYSAEQHLIILLTHAVLVSSKYTIRLRNV